nr:MAG TPA: hypothetical protein [Caudoviricetes sp.]
MMNTAISNRYFEEEQECVKNVNIVNIMNVVIAL